VGIVKHKIHAATIFISTPTNVIIFFFILLFFAQNEKSKKEQG